MELQKHFVPDIDRYVFDLDHCSYSKGWCQVDTGQDAAYFGTWINAEQRKILTYLEGDVYIVTAADASELVQEVEKIRRWNIQAGHDFSGIDPGLNPDVKARLVEFGLGPYLSGNTGEQ